MSVIDDSDSDIEILNPADLRKTFFQHQRRLVFDIKNCGGNIPKNWEAFKEFVISKIKWTPTEDIICSVWKKLCVADLYVTGKASPPLVIELSDDESSSDFSNLASSKTQKSQKAGVIRIIPKKNSGNSESRVNKSNSLPGTKNYVKNGLKLSHPSKVLNKNTVANFASCPVLKQSSEPIENVPVTSWKSVKSVLKPLQRSEPSGLKNPVDVASVRSVKHQEFQKKNPSKVFSMPIKNVWSPPAASQRDTPLNQKLVSSQHMQITTGTSHKSVGGLQAPKIQTPSKKPVQNRKMRYSRRTLPHSGWKIQVSQPSLNHKSFPHSTNTEDLSNKPVQNLNMRDSRRTLPQSGRKTQVSQPSISHNSFPHSTNTKGPSNLRFENLTGVASSKPSPALNSRPSSHSLHSYNTAPQPVTVGGKKPDEKLKKFPHIIGHQVTVTPIEKVVEKPVTQCFDISSDSSSSSSQSSVIVIDESCNVPKKKRKSKKRKHEELPTSMTEEEAQKLRDELLIDKLIELELPNVLRSCMNIPVDSNFLKAFRKRRRNISSIKTTTNTSFS